MAHTKACLVLLVALGLCGCQRDQSDVSTVPESARVVADVVARVGSQAIGASDVAARMAVEGLDAKTALERLIDEELLAQEAGRRGITLDAAAHRTTERIMVRAMLRDFEEDLTPERVPMEEVQADFDEYEEKFQVPERRDSWHILVKDSTTAGQEMAASILAEVRRSDDPKTVYAKYQDGDQEGAALGVTAEDLPAITPKAGIEKPYKDALFGAKSIGVLKQPVQTSYGWHVIVLTDIVPGGRRGLSDVEDEIRQRLSQKKRFEKLVETVRAAEAKGLIQYDDESVKRLLSTSGLPKRAE